MGRPSERRYRMLQKWAKNGVFLVEPEDNGRVLVVTVTELASLTVDEAKRRPDKVQAAIQTTLDKAIQKTAEKPPAMGVVPRPVIDARGSIPSGSHPGRTIARGKKGQGPQRANGGRRAASRCVPNVGRPMPGFVFWGGGGRVCARGFLDKNDDGSISSTGRSDLYRARADLLKSKILVEENGQIWRAKY